MDEAGAESAGRTDSGETNPHREYLQARYLSLALELKAGVLSPEDFSKKLTEERLKLEDNAEKDGLTELYSRKHMEGEIDRELRERGGKGGVGLVMVDLDNFKGVNDQFGHPAGDRVLKAFSKMAMEILENTGGSAGRWGGEEFILLIPETDTRRLGDICDKLGEHIRSEAGPQSGISRIQTASMGAVTSVAGENGEQLIDRADKLLYEAKNAGRDRVILENSDGTKKISEFGTGK